MTTTEQANTLRHVMYVVEDALAYAESQTDRVWRLGTPAGQALHESLMDLPENWAAILEGIINLDVNEPRRTGPMMTGLWPSTPGEATADLAERSRGREDGARDDQPPAGDGQVFTTGRPPGPTSAGAGPFDVGPHTTH